MSDEQPRRPDAVRPLTQLRGDGPADLAAIHESWLQIPEPTAQDAEAYLRALREWRRRHGGDGPPEEEARIDTPWRLWAWCRHRQGSFVRLESDAAGMPPAVAGPVRFAWERLRELAGTAAYPLEPEPPADYPGAIRALDPVINWCARRIGVASVACPPNGQAPPRVVLGAQGDRPLVLGSPKSPLTSAQYDVVKALLDAGAAGLAKAQLVRKSGHGDAVNVLKRLAKKDPDWGRVIRLPGAAGKGYRVG